MHPMTWDPSRAQRAGGSVTGRHGSQTSIGGTGMVIGRSLSIRSNASSFRSTHSAHNAAAMMMAVGGPPMFVGGETSHGGYEEDDEDSHHGTAAAHGVAGSTGGSGWHHVIRRNLSRSHLSQTEGVGSSGGSPFLPSPPNVESQGAGPSGLARNPSGGVKRGQSFPGNAQGSSPGDLLQQATLVREPSTSSSPPTSSPLPSQSSVVSRPSQPQVSQTSASSSSSPLASLHASPGHEASGVSPPG